MANRRITPLPVRALIRRAIWAVAPPPHESTRLWLRHGLKWHLDEFRPTEAGAFAQAWAAVPRSTADRLTLAVNGVTFDKQERVARPDVRQATPPLRRLTRYEVVGVYAWGNGPSFRYRPGEWVRVEFLDTRTGVPALGPPEWHRFPSPSDPPLPDPARMIRVGGHDSAEPFLTTGMRVFGSLRHGLRSVTGRDVSDFPQVLDWGCGCGRLTRYLTDYPVAVTGTDVDADNVAWCARNLPGRFETIPLHPPMPFADGSFDLAIGTSVFTHLTEPVQFEWLAELRRVVRPGGILLLSVLGDAAIQDHKLTAEHVRRRNRTGFLDVTQNRILDGYLAEADYYRDVYHAAWYVRREWGKFFDVMRLIPGGLGVQDLVVLRRR